ncbi:hypothetical protein [Deinococcus sp.]|uniref:hypothetical protein n=1 Tax=Deinococcus sp. TaxID=47478 RepID=UPI0025E2E4AA|nr:hypothetical protein [Deinococcus sp.]
MQTPSRRTQLSVVLLTALPLFLSGCIIGGIPSPAPSSLSIDYRGNGVCTKVKLTTGKSELGGSLVYKSGDEYITVGKFQYFEANEATLDHDDIYSGVGIFVDAAMILDLKLQCFNGLEAKSVYVFNSVTVTSKEYRLTVDGDGSADSGLKVAFALNKD